MARKSYFDEFKRDAVALYRDIKGATITVIAAELGVSEATLSAWGKAAGVLIRRRRGVVGAGPATGMEGPGAGVGPSAGRGEGIARHRGSAVYRA